MLPWTKVEKAFGKRAGHHYGGEDAAEGSPWERRCVHNTSQGSDDYPFELLR